MYKLAYISVQTKQALFECLPM